MDEKKLVAFASLILWSSLFFHASAAPTLAQEYSPPSYPHADLRNNAQATDLNSERQVEQMFAAHIFGLELAPVDSQVYDQFEAGFVRGQPKDIGAVVSKVIARVIYNSAAKRTLNDDIIESKALRSGTLRSDLYER